MTSLVKFFNIMIIILWADMSLGDFVGQRLLKQFFGLPENSRIDRLNKGIFHYNFVRIIVFLNEY